MVHIVYIYIDTAMHHMVHIVYIYIQTYSYTWFCPYSIYIYRHIAMHGAAHIYIYVQIHIAMHGVVSSLSTSDSQRHVAL